MRAVADVTTAGLRRHGTEVSRVISTRLRIEQAGGVVARHLRIDDDAALDELRRHSARTSRSLSQVATAILDDDDRTGPVLLMRGFDRASIRPLRALVHGRLTAAGLPELPAADFLCAVNEAVINAVVHGGGGGRLWLWRHAGNLWCEVSDDGPGMPAGRTAPVQPPDPHAESGRGVWLIKQICAGLDITATATGGARFLLRYPAPD
jgi:anti-sigma regulatory factor (Ser/Thr protein kinase)